MKGFMKNQVGGYMMKKQAEGIMILIGIVGLVTFLIQPTDSFGAKEPEYPVKPITYYISYQAGGATDILVRALIEPAGKVLGQPFVVVNKPGGGALLGSVAVLNSKPDGYTLGSFAGTQALIAPHTEECPYKDINGFTFITNYGKWINPVFVRGDSPFKTWKEFIEWARKNPRGAKVAIPGSRSQTASGLTMWEMEQKEGVELTYISTKGTPEQITGVLGGHMTMAATVMDATMMQYVKEGKLRFLAFHGKEKVAGFENVPSFYEMYGIEDAGYVGIWGPKGIPDYILDKLEDAFVKGLKDPNFVTVMKRMNLPVVYMNRRQLDKEMRPLFTKMGQAVRTLMAEEAKKMK
jgi:tripartite-type tricarboxylate transporter receptor subunit TctC